MKKHLLISIVSILMLIGCASKDDELYNKSSSFWYQQIVDDIAASELDKADNHYTSFISEHPASELIENVMLMLAIGHMHEEEYILANFYIDEYIKRYGNNKNIDYARYLKIKANFESFASVNRNQDLLTNTIADTRFFLANFPNSPYKPLVQTMLTKMYLGELYLNKSIMDLYLRTDKTVSAEIYRQKLQRSPFYGIETIKPNLPWYKAIFE